MSPHHIKTLENLCQAAAHHDLYFTEKKSIGKNEPIVICLLLHHETAGIERL